MHYKNGREAKLGDRVVYQDGTNFVSGYLIAAVAGSESCNGQVLVPGSAYPQYITIGNLYHVEDAVLKAAPKKTDRIHFITSEGKEVRARASSEVDPHYTGPVNLETVMGESHVQVPHSSPHSGISFTWHHSHER